MHVARPSRTYKAAGFETQRVTGLVPIFSLPKFSRILEQFLPMARTKQDVAKSKEILSKNVLKEDYIRLDTLTQQYVSRYGPDDEEFLKLNRLEREKLDNCIEELNIEIDEAKVRSQLIMLTSVAQYSLSFKAGALQMILLHCRVP
jgi:hypothetical protein